jgi:hypothetical protein
LSAEERRMLFRHVIYRLFLCLAFVSASSHAQAMSNMGLGQTIVGHHEVHAPMPPCHEVMDDTGSEKGGTHKGGCCSTFACCLGLVSETAILERAALIPTYESSGVRSLRSTLFRPLFPPPKSI